MSAGDGGGGERAASSAGTPTGSAPADSGGGRSPRTLILIATAAVGLAAVLFGVRVWQMLDDPKILFLSDGGNAEWIRRDLPFSFGALPPETESTHFVLPFALKSPVLHVHFTVRAFRRFAVIFDRKKIYVGPENFDLWKDAKDVEIPGTVAAGNHQLEINVWNNGAHPCLLVQSQQLPLQTGPRWRVTERGGRLRPAVSVNKETYPAFAEAYASARDSFRAVLPYLAIVFAVSFSWTLWSGRVTPRPADGLRSSFSPPRVRWILIVAWIILAANNSWRLFADFGFDITGHMEYLEFIHKHGRLPLASDGWEMHQPPLFYLLAFPEFALLTPHFKQTFVIKALRLIPLLCGLVQIEVVYRAARTVFPGKNDLQTMATIVGGLLPMQIYISQVIGNEPVAGCLSSATILFCLILVVEPAGLHRRRFFIAMGAVWGLALLSKVTALMLSPLVIAAIVVASRKSVLPMGRSAFHIGRNRIGLAVGTCARLRLVFCAKLDELAKSLRIT